MAGVGTDLRGRGRPEASSAFPIPRVGRACKDFSYDGLLPIPTPESVKNGQRGRARGGTLDVH